MAAVQSLSRVPLSATPWTAARQASLPLTISLSLLKLTSIESVMPSNRLVLCCVICSCKRPTTGQPTTPNRRQAGGGRRLGEGVPLEGGDVWGPDRTGRHWEPEWVPQRGRFMSCEFTSINYFFLKGKPYLNIFEEFNKPTLKTHGTNV